MFLKSNCEHEICQLCCPDDDGSRRHRTDGTIGWISRQQTGREERITSARGGPEAIPRILWIYPDSSGTVRGLLLHRRGK